MSGIRDFLCLGQLLKEFNHSFITLISKVVNPEAANHYCPSSLYDTFYKIIARILVNRMLPSLEHIVQSTQSAFVLHRAIRDNILLAYEVMNKFHCVQREKRLSNSQT